MSLPPSPSSSGRFGGRRLFTITLATAGALFALLLSTILWNLRRQHEAFPEVNTTYDWDLIIPGLIGICLGLGFLIALLARSVWNRRNAGSDPTPRSWWQASRPLCFAVATLLTLIGLFYAVENWRGAKAWAETQARIRAAGDCLDLSCLMPPPLPDERNFAKIPALALAMDLVPTGSPRYFGQTYVINTNPEAVAVRARLQAIHLIPPKAGRNSFRAARLPNGLLDLADWSAKQEQNTNFTAITSTGNPAADLLLRLQQKDDVLNAITTGLEKRPEARYSTHPEDLYNALLPPLALIKGLSQTLSVRSTVRLHTGDAAGAFADARASFRFAETLKSEYYLISQLVRISMHATAHRALAEGMAVHGWSDAQLAEWQRLEAGVDFKAGMLEGYRWERALGCLGIEQLSHNPRLATIVFGELEAVPLLSLMPHGWWQQNQAALVTHFDPLFAAAQSTPPGLFPDGSPTANATGLRPREIIPSGPYTVLVRRLGRGLEPTFGKANQATMSSRLAGVACALERHRLQQGQFPESLAGIAPAHLNAAQTHDMDGQPLRYHRTTDGWYQLYSIGNNGIDDDGEYREKAGTSDLDWPWPVPVGEGHRMF